MKVKAKKTLKRRLTFEEAKDLECQLMRRQRRGAIPLCYRPKPKERDEGEEPKCQLKYFLPAPTFRFCPQCAIYRRNVSSLWSHRSKKAKEILVEEFRSANFDTIARDKTQLLAINSQLAKELGEKKALLAGLKGLEHCNARAIFQKPILSGTSQGRTKSNFLPDLSSWT
jgi:hypothetical protein